jgi:hypothetical protein
MPGIFWPRRGGGLDLDADHATVCKLDEDVDVTLTRHRMSIWHIVGCSFIATPAGARTGAGTITSASFGPK